MTSRGGRRYWKILKFQQPPSPVHRYNEFLISRFFLCINFHWLQNTADRLQGPVHSTPKKFENPALLKRLGLPCTRSSIRRNLKTPALRFRVERNILKIYLSENDGVQIIMWFPSNTNPKWPMIVVFSIFPDVVWTEYVWYVFRVKTPFLNFSGVERTQLQVSSNCSVKCSIASTLRAQSTLLASIFIAVP